MFLKDRLSQKNYKRLKTFAVLDEIIKKKIAIKEREREKEKKERVSERESVCVCERERETDRQTDRQRGQRIGLS